RGLHEHDVHRLDDAGRARRRSQAAPLERRPALPRLQRPEHHEDLRDHRSRPGLHDLPVARRGARDDRSVDDVVRASAAVALVLLTLAAAGCASGTGGVAPANADKNAGKRLFTEKCGACHTLRDAGTKGTIGPNLDNSFRPSREQGFAESTVRQVVRDQIEFAGVYGLRGPTMPKNLATGSDADEVAAYVAYVAGTTNSVTAPA